MHPSHFSLIPRYLLLSLLFFYFLRLVYKTGSQLVTHDLWRIIENFWRWIDIRSLLIVHLMKITAHDYYKFLFSLGSCIDCKLGSFLDVGTVHHDDNS